MSMKHEPLLTAKALVSDMVHLYGAAAGPRPCRSETYGLQDFPVSGGFGSLCALQAGSAVSTEAT